MPVWHYRVRFQVKDYNNGRTQVAEFSNADDAKALRKIIKDRFGDRLVFCQAEKYQPLED